MTDLLAPSPAPGSELPRLIRMHANDNVAIVANDFGLAAGTEAEAGLRLRERIPSMRPRPNPDPDVAQYQPKPEFRRHDHGCEPRMRKAAARAAIAAGHDAATTGRRGGSRL